MDVNKGASGGSGEKNPGDQDMNTKKHETFVSSPMRGKPVTDVPGIGPQAGAKLKEAGYDTAEKLFGKYLALGRDSTEFSDWLKTTAGMTAHHAKACSDAFKEWYDSYM